MNFTLLNDDLLYRLGFQVFKLAENVVTYGKGELRLKTIWRKAGFRDISVYDGDRFIFKFKDTEIIQEIKSLKSNYLVVRYKQRVANGYVPVFDDYHEIIKNNFKFGLTNYIGHATLFISLGEGEYI